MRLAILLCLSVTLSLCSAQTGEAYFYSHENSGRLMSNGQPFDPSAMTAASWFYNLGERVEVTSATIVGTNVVIISIVVTVTDRGPDWRLVHEQNRVIDLSAAAFRRLASPALGHVSVYVRPVSHNP